jgi:hyperosmotically inducible protein
MQRRIFIIAVAGVVMLSLACARPQNENEGNRNGPASNSNAANSNEGARTGASDTWITAKVKLALLADGRVSGFATDVDTNGGAVTLSGKVDSEENKSTAGEVARAIDGVRSVNNQIQVVPDEKRDQVNATDDKIEDAIGKAMETDANLTDQSIAAEVNAGVVTLSGSVDTPDQLVKAAQAIRKIPGVKSVVTTPVTVSENR